MWLIIREREGGGIGREGVRDILFGLFALHFALSRHFVSKHIFFRHSPSASLLVCARARVRCVRALAKEKKFVLRTFLFAFDDFSNVVRLIGRERRKERKNERRSRHLRRRESEISLTYGTYVTAFCSPKCRSMCQSSFF